MYLKELMSVFKYCQIELHSGYDGKLVAKSRSTLEKYGEVTVLSAYPRISVNRDGDNAMAYIYAYVDYRDVDEIRRKS